MAFLRQEWKFSLRDSSFPDLFHMELSDTHSLESPPDRAKVFSMQIGSQVGAVVPLYFLGEAVGWERCEPLSLPWLGLCIGLCRLGLCVAVTQIAVGESGSGGAVYRTILII